MIGNTTDPFGTVTYYAINVDSAAKRTWTAVKSVVSLIILKTLLKSIYL